jgi:hypothetical protein
MLVPFRSGHHGAAFALGLGIGMVLPAFGLATYDAWKSQPTVPSTIWTENQK